MTTPTAAERLAELQRDLEADAYGIRGKWYPEEAVEKLAAIVAELLPREPDGIDQIGMAMQADLREDRTREALAVAVEALDRAKDGASLHRQLAINKALGRIRELTGEKP